MSGAGHSQSRAAEIKRLVACGEYQVDPIAVADAMIRRGFWQLQGRRPPRIIVHPPVTLRREPS